MTYQEALAWAREQLKLSSLAVSDTAVDTAALDAEVLLAYACGVPRSSLWSQPKTKLVLAQEQTFVMSITKRKQGMPVAYITGVCEFWSLPIHVTPDVLIPRPETEHLIEVICANFPDKNQTLRCLELGTGSGAITLALASERPNWQFTAVDISSAALTVAKNNAAQLGMNHIEFIQSNWFSALAEQTFELIVSNPPYLEENDPHLQTSIRFEPRPALVAGITGLEAYTAILAVAKSHLTAGGMIIVEHGYQQAEALQTLLAQHGFSKIESYPDLQGILRVTKAIHT